MKQRSGYFLKPIPGVCSILPGCFYGYLAEAGNAFACKRTGTLPLCVRQESGITLYKKGICAGERFIFFI